MKQLLLLPLLLLVSCQPVADSIKDEVDQVIEGINEGLEAAISSGGLIVIDEQRDRTDG